MNTSLLYEELAPLNAQIAETQQKLDDLTASLRVIDADLQSHLAEKERFEALRDVCNALDHLDQLDAGDLFWGELPDIATPEDRLRTLRDRIATFEEQTAHVEAERNALKAEIDNCLWELGDLDEEVRQAYARDERRQEEFVIEREMPPAPFLAMVMPWNIDVSSEKCFRKTLLISLSWCVLLGVILPMITLPVIDRSVEVVEIPERLVTLVKKEPIRPEPVPPPRQEEPKPVEPEKPKPETSEQTAKTEKPVKKAETVKKVAGGGKKDARKKAETTGVLAFKGTFTDLMDEVPVAKLGTDAKVKNSKDIPGQSQARRNLVAMQAKSGTSGGISNFGVSRNLGNGGSGGGSGYGNAGQIGGVGFSRVESAVAGIGGEEGRPTAGGPGPGRTDEEIQIVFDRYKATLYRIYNKELRKDPTLRGKLLLKLTIEPEGEVSLCRVESTDLGSDTLVAQIVDRVSRFNFGPKEDVPPTTILYPIDFLPAT